MCERESDQKRKLVAAQSKQSSKLKFSVVRFIFQRFSPTVEGFPELLKRVGEGHLF
jgi:hypothetical protein